LDSPKVCISWSIKGFRTAKKPLLAENKTVKIKKAGPNDPALIEENCDGLVYQEKCMVSPARSLLHRNHLPLTGIFAAGNYNWD
jgi:hypothetical protein